MEADPLPHDMNSSSVSSQLPNSAFLQLYPHVANNDEQSYEIRHPNLDPPVGHTNSSDPNICADFSTSWNTSNHNLHDEQMAGYSENCCRVCQQAMSFVRILLFVLSTNMY